MLVRSALAEGYVLIRREESPLGAAERAFFVSIVLYGDEHADLFARCAAEIIVVYDSFPVLLWYQYSRFFLLWGQLITYFLGFGG